MNGVDLDSLIKGAIDMHIHAAPDTMPMRLDGLEAARQAREVGMKAIVLKNHHYPTAPLATMVGQLVPDIAVFGGITLDYEVGGLNAHALKSAAEHGAKVVWMATHCAANARSLMPPGLVGEAVEAGYSILDDNGELVPEIAGILALVKKYDMVLASGHISPAEIFALFAEAQKAGIRKLLVTHASNGDVVKEALSLEQQRELAGMGVYIEHAGADIMPCDFGHDPAEMAAMIKAAGAEHCILSSDMGLSYGLFPAEGLRVFIATLTHHNITPAEIELMIKVNPARLLGLD
jgi:hypothetical protein